VERFGVEGVGEVSEVEEPVEDRLPETAPATRQAPEREHDEPLAQLRRLEAELERYREHAQRTSKLFLSVTKYVEWVRENARSEAELALRKARARVEKLDRVTRELEESELKLSRVRDDLARLEIVSEEARTRLAAFLSAGLEALDTRASAEGRPTVDIQDTLLERVASSPVSEASHATTVESPRQ